MMLYLEFEGKVENGALEGAVQDGDGPERETVYVGSLKEIDKIIQKIKAQKAK